MSKFLVVFLLLISGLASADTKLGVMGSLSFNSPELKDDAGLKEKSEIGFGLGMRALVGLSDQLFLRTGAGIIQKKGTIELEGPIKGDTTTSIVYLNIPATLYVKASPQVGIFGGTNLNAKLSDDTDSSGALVGNELENINSIVFPLVLGFDFNFTEELSMEISYEHGMMETADDLKVNSAVVSLIYNFEN